MSFLLINKPEGWTSFDVVAVVRKKYRAQHPEDKKVKVGHAGTLDPFATGLLIVAIGREDTKKIDEFKKLNLQSKYPEAILISAQNSEGIEELLETISIKFENYKGIIKREA